MVATTVDNNRNCRFVLRPNRSLSWHQVRFFWYGMVVVGGIVGAGFAALGYWPVLPFAGAEVLALGAALYVTARRGSVSEVVHVSADTVEVARGSNAPTQCWTFARAWAQVLLKTPTHPWYPARLVIRSHGREVELGSFLNDEERLMLAKNLTQAIRAAPGSPTVLTLC